MHSLKNKREAFSIEKKNKTSKFRKVHYLEDTEVVVEELFTLPKSSTKKRGRPKIFNIKSNKTGDNVKDFTAIKRKREEFRQRLIQLIIKKEGEHSSPNEIPNADEREMLKYYYFIHHGIDTAHVSPIEDNWLRNIHDLIPEKLKKWKTVLKLLDDEVQQDFITAVKEAIIHFVLTDCNENENSYKRIVKFLPKFWDLCFEDYHSLNPLSFYRSHRYINKNLYTINACLPRILELWSKSFCHLRLVDVKEISKIGHALTLHEFNSLCNVHIEAAKDCLKTHWYPLIQNILEQVKKRKLIPNEDNAKASKCFFNCVACLMTHQLQNLCIDSLHDYEHFLRDVGFSNQGFIIKVDHYHSVIIFEPSFKMFRETLLKIYDTMVDAVKIFPRIENVLQKCTNNDGNYLKPVILEDIIEALKGHTSHFLEDQRVGPELSIQNFDEYIDLLNGNAENEVSVFVAGNNTFQDYVTTVLKFHELSITLPLRVAHVVTLGTYEIHRVELIKKMVQKAKELETILLKKMVQDYQQICKQLGEEYEAISQQALMPPTSTSELMEFIKFINDIETRVILEMEGRLRVVMNYLCFTSDYNAFSSTEMKQNSTTFQWYRRMPEVIEQSKSIVKSKLKEFQEFLKARVNKFEEDMELYNKQADEFSSYGEVKDLHKYVKKANHLDKKLNEALGKIDHFNEEEAAFGFKASEYPVYKVVTEKLIPYKKLYDNSSLFLSKYDQWMNSRVGTYHPNDIEDEVSNCYEVICKSEKTFSDSPQPQKLASAIRIKIVEFRKHMPIIQTLGNPGMKERHWEKVSEIVGFPIKPDENLTLEKIIDFGLDEFISKFETISEAATKENNLEKALTKMQNEWSAIKFTITLYRDTGTYILSAIDDIQLLLDDHIVKTQTMKSSAYIKPFEKEIIEWENKLMLLQEILDDWLKVQSTWMYLEPIFSSPDIHTQMPEEGRRFNAVDKIWRDIMKSAMADCHVLVVIQIEKMLERLKKCNTLLDLIQRGLNDYLEIKRLYFPRFFFLSNDELLEILSETKNPKRVQPHLKKCFGGIQELNFTEDLIVKAIVSPEKEEVPLVVPISTADAHGQVEKWLKELEQVMKSSIHHAIQETIDGSTGHDKGTWTMEYPGQAVLSVNILNWTSETCNSMKKGISSLKLYLQIYEEQMKKIVSIASANLHNKDRITLGALIIMDVHARDVITSLIEKEITDSNSFEWLSQLRYYWIDKNLYAKMINAELCYGYEYLGNTPRLVITPLTERCYRTLFLALSLHLGGAIEGTAATGKTETTKDLTKALGKQCILFNCSQNLDHLALGKFFKGLASCGAWSCFDEFNRIDHQILSLAAQQILTIRLAILSDMKTIKIDGVEIELDRTCAIFITLHPHYPGRNKLPDNLKMLFRPVALMVPNFSIISRVLLYASGFNDVHTLSLKIVAFHKNCSEQLSSQDHYDFGMRAIKTVLDVAKELKQKNHDNSENHIIFQSIYKVHEPKLVSFDLSQFQDIASDLFPGISMSPCHSELFHEAIKFACEARNIKSSEIFVKKIIQLHSMLDVKHGIMIIGPPGGGKTTLYQVLSAVLTYLHEKNLMNERKAQIVVINPKSITLGQLFGQFDPTSHEWCDGILAVTYRQFAVTSNKDRKWIIFDGPVDSVWIETMNTVLDDNKKLCLTSGEIINLSPTTSLLFETMNLEAASPATVSRCATIYVDPVILDWKSLLISWLRSLPESITKTNRLVIQAMFERFIPVLQHFVRNCNNQELIATSDLGMIRGVMNLFDCFLEDFNDAEAVKKLTDIEIRAQLEGIFFFSCMWGMAGSLEADSRDKFSDIFKGLMSKDVPKELLEEIGYDEPVTAPNKPFIFIVPTEGQIFDYKFVKESKGKWKPWSDYLSSAPAIPREIPVNQIIVTTVETIRNMEILRLLMKNGKAALFVGPTGTGKSAYVADVLFHKLDAQQHVPHCMYFSPYTNSNLIQDLIMGKLDKRRKGVYGPPLGKKFIYFIDDVNMPVKEKFGAQPPIELLRQWLDHWIWFDRKDNCAIKLMDIQLICAMGPVNAGGNTLCPRFLRHFMVLGINEFNDTIMKAIFSKIMLWHLDTRGFSKEFDPCIGQVVNSTLTMYNSARAHLLPTPEKPHYLFNLRDFTRVVQGVLLSVPESTEDLLALKKLWVHEILRVFFDRLTDMDDINKMCNALHLVVKEHLEENLNDMFSYLFESDEENQIGEIHLRKIIYCDFANTKGDTRNYIECVDFNYLTSLCENYITEYNNMSKKPINFVIFRYAIEHLCRVCRILKQPRSHGLMLGPSGSGRQYVCRLATHMSEYELFQVEITKQYSMSEWREELRNVLQTVASNDSQCVFLFTDNQVKELCFLEDVNSILNYGEIPNIFSVDEKADLCEKVRPIDQQRDKVLQTDGSYFALYNFFIEVVRNQLHILLCMDPRGSEFRKYIRLFPAFITNCSINWFHTWPEDAFLAVAHHFLSELDVSEKELNACIDVCQNFHTTTQKMTTNYELSFHRHYYVTPTHYLDVISIFKELLVKKREEVLKTKQCYVLGIEKIDGAAGEVQVLEDDLETLKPELAKSSTLVEEDQQLVEKQSDIVIELEKVVSRDEAEAEKQAALTQEIRNSCDIQFSEAMPLLNEAAEMLNSLTPQDISVIKSMKSPTEGVKLVMEAVCLLEDIQPDQVPDPSAPGTMLDDYWEPSKRILGDENFIDSLLTFDKDNVPEQVITTLEMNFLSDEEFDPEIIKSSSLAAEALCKWVISIVTHYKIAKEIEPKKEHLLEAENKFAETMSALEEKRSQLHEEQDKLNKLQKTLDEHSAQHNQLLANSDLCAKKLQRAKDLISVFGGEKDTWLTSIHDMEQKYICLTGDILISSGIIAYLGPFTKELRQELIALWLKTLTDYDITYSNDFTLIGILGDSVMIKEWNIYGLPQDPFSIDNGIISKYSKRYSLMIDPQEQANKWIKNLEKANNLNVIRFSQADYLRILENAVQFGQPVLLENIGEEIDSILDPLLQKQIFKQGNNKTIKIGDSMVEYSEDFRLYITTKLRNPHYSPDIQIRVSIINFIIGSEGLENQLLEIVATKEFNTLVSERKQLLLQGADNGKTIKETENKILHAFFVSEGNILEDEAIVNLLTSSKGLVNEVSEKQKAIDENETKIYKTFEIHKSIAKYGTILFFCIADLANVNPMYQFSLTWFVELFSSSIEKMEKNKEVSLLIESWKRKFTYLLYTKMSRSTFEKDQLLFSLIITTSVMKMNDEIDNEEWIFFLTRDSHPDTHCTKTVPWLSDKSWNYIFHLDKMINFAGIRQHIAEHPDDWKEINDNIHSDTISLPNEWSKRLKDFSKMLLISCVYPDRVVTSIQKLVEDKMGKEYLTAVTFDIASYYADSCSTRPLIFLLTPANDPTTLLLQFADEQGVNRNRLVFVAVGEHQMSIAQRSVIEGTRSGNWIVLQNCHLERNFTPVLERLYEGFTVDNTHPDFRLWLTSYPCDYIPLSILQNGVKIIYEQPTGLKENILRSYLSEPLSDTNFFEGCYQPVIFKKLLFGLVLFHAVIQERLEFGSIGWNNPYEFNETDLSICIQQLQLTLNDFPKEVKIDLLLSISGDCIYGGRITDEWDYRTLGTLLKKVYCRELIEQEHYVLDTKGKYYTFEAKKHDVYVKYAQSLPIISHPEVFGMNENAGLTREQKEGERLLEKLLLTQNKGFPSRYGSKLPDEIVLEFSEEILKKLPKCYDMEHAMAKYPAKFDQCLNGVLIREMEQFNVLLTCIQMSLVEVLNAITGKRVFSFNHNEIFDSILMGKIPKVWIKKSYPSLKSLSSYINDLLQRLNFIQNWCDEGIPTVFWISGFFFPQSFLAAVLQNFSRKHQIAIYNITFDTEIRITEQTNDPPEEGVNINGLFLEGACWHPEAELLDESIPRVHFSKMPTIFLKPIESKQLEVANRYVCPVYNTSERRGILSTSGHSTNFVFSILLPTNIPPEHWILRGVGLLCQLSDQ